MNIFAVPSEVSWSETVFLAMKQMALIIDDVTIARITVWLQPQIC